MNTLRGKFLFFILLPVVTGLIGLTGATYYTARQHLFESMRSSGVNLLKADAERIQSFIIKERSILESIAKTHPLASYDDEQRKRIADEIHEILDDFVVSVFMNFSDDSIIRSTSIALPAGYDHKTRPWYTIAAQLPTGQRQGFTEPYFDAGMNRLIMTHFRIIYDQNGSWVGVIGIDLDIGEMAEISNSYHEMNPSIIRFQMTNDSRIIIHPDVSKVDTYLDRSKEAQDIKIVNALKDKNNKFYQTIDHRDGSYWYMGYHHVEKSQSNIVLMMPAEEILRPLNRLIRESILLSIFFVTILAGILLLVAKKMSKPIYALTDAAERIVENENYQDPLAIESRDELGHLTQAFNLMMDGLRQRDFIRDTFGRYVTTEVVEALLDDPDGLRLGGEKREVTVMFCDIRGFTPLSEHLEPDQVIDLLNRYLGTMSAIVTRYKGVISEFQGDSILAFFGAPVEHGDSPSRAVACAVAMQRAMTGINSGNIEKGLPEVFMGIGINTGNVIVGNIGSEKRAKYGVVGHAINLASRVEASTIGGQVLITDTTYQQAKSNVVSETVFNRRLKGVTKKVLLHNVTGVTYPEKMRLPQLADNTPLLVEPLEVEVSRMKDREEAEIFSCGKLTHFSPQYLRVDLDHEISTSTEIRLQMSDTDMDRDSLYGRIVESRKISDDFSHLVRISYIPSQISSRIGSKVRVSGPSASAIS